MIWIDAESLSLINLTRRPARKQLLVDENPPIVCVPSVCAKLKDEATGIDMADWECERESSNIPYGILLRFCHLCSKNKITRSTVVNEISLARNQIGFV